MSRAGSPALLGSTEPRGLTNGIDDGSSSRRGSVPGGAYPHINELVAQAEAKLDPHAPMRALLQQADQAAKRAEADLSFGRLDYAYVQYLIAADLVANHVARHKDYPDLRNSRGQLYQLLLDLQKRLNGRHDTFKRIGDEIREDNTRSGVRPRNARRDEENGLNNDAENWSNQRPPSRTPYDNADAISMPDGPVQNGNVNFPSPARQASVRNPAVSSPPRRKPAVHPKPDRLQSRPGSSRQSQDANAGSLPPDVLADRFAKLRNPSKSPPVSPGAPGQRPQSMRNMSISSPSHSTFGSRPIERPSGPRDQTRASEVPIRPPKIPLTMDVNTPLPKQPSPTYSPARTVQPAGGHDRATYREAGSISGSANLDQQSIVTQRRDQEAEPRMNGSHRLYGDDDHREQEPASDLPRSFTISTDELYKYIGQGSDRLRILIIDVRPRRDFDEGHIFTHSILCVEPLILHSGMSAEEIEERLVLSSEPEQTLFGQRDKYDLVVFHDQSSTSLKTAEYVRPNPDKVALMTLEQALVSFNYSKPLKRPPVLLAGGIEAWQDLVGPQALQSTPAPRRALLKRANSPATLGRPLARVPKARSSQRLQDSVQVPNSGTNGRMEEQFPTQASVSEHQQNGHEPVPAYEDETAGTTTDTTSPVSYTRDYEDFLHRFPEVSDIKESMTSPTSPRRGRSGTILDDKFHGFARVPQSPTEGPTPTPPGPISRPSIAVPRPSFKGESEKTYQPPLPERPPPLIPRSSPAPVVQKPRYSDIRVGQTGLQNFGATCYMNAVVQCLSGTTPLTRFFLDGSFRPAIQRENRLGTRGKLPDIYASVMKYLWDGNSTFIVPRTLREFVANDNAEFDDPSTQHDANDFFVYILDRLHEDLNYNFGRNVLKSLTTEDERKRERMPPQVVSRIEYNRYCHRNNSWISRLFDGQHSSRLQCRACGCSSTSYETFSSISLEIPRGATDLHQCLDNYTKQEILTGDDAWLCPECRTPREAWKKITFTRAPRVLVIQLKRFQTVRRGLTNKNTANVRFPLIQLNLDPYMLPRISPPEALADARARYGDAVLEPELETSPPYRYDAYAVVQHAGSLSTGHYTALVRTDMHRDTWVEFNDKHVSPVSAERVNSEKAYLLFYVRSDTH